MPMSPCFLNWTYHFILFFCYVYDSRSHYFYHSCANDCLSGPWWKLKTITKSIKVMRIYIFDYEIPFYLPAELISVNTKKNFFFYPKTLGYKQYILTSITYLLPIKRGCSHTVILCFNKTFNIDSTRWYCIHISMSDSIKHETFFHSSQHIHHPGKRGSPQTKKTQVGFQLDCESESKEESKSIQKGK